MHHCNMRVILDTVVQFLKNPSTLNQNCGHLYANHIKRTSGTSNVRLRAYRLLWDGILSLYP